MQERVTPKKEKKRGANYIREVPVMLKLINRRFKRFHTRLLHNETIYDVEDVWIYECQSHARY